MRTSYDARVEDLRPSDYVLVERVHTQLLTKSMLQRYGLHPHDRMMDLGERMRCRQCDERGKRDNLDQMGEVECRQGFAGALESSHLNKCYGSRAKLHQRPDLVPGAPLHLLRRFLLYR